MTDYENNYGYKIIEEFNKTCEQYLEQGLMCFIRWLKIYHDGEYIYTKSESEIIEEYIKFIQGKLEIVPKE